MPEATTEQRPYARFADWSRRHLPPVVPVGRPPLAGLAPEPGDPADDHEPTTASLEASGHLNRLGGRASQRPQRPSRRPAVP